MNNELIQISYFDQPCWFAVKWDGDKMVWIFLEDVVKSFRFEKDDVSKLLASFTDFFQKEQAGMNLKIGDSLIIACVYDFGESYKLRCYWENVLWCNMDMNGVQFKILIESLEMDI